MKDIKDVFIGELKKTWGNDSHMVEYCLKKCSQIVELENGLFITFDKPSIKTDFCFGYGYFDDGTGASNMAAVARRSEDYFLNENLKEIQSQIDVLKDDNYFCCLCGAKYQGLDKDSPYRFYNVKTSYQLKGDEEFMSVENKQRIINALEVEKAKFEKRLRTYLKRYGLSKIRSWTYLVD